MTSHLSTLLNYTLHVCSQHLFENPLRVNGTHASLCGRRLKGKGKEVWGARETRGAREEGGRKENACQETIVLAIPPTNYVCKNNATVNDLLSNKSGRDALI